MISQNRSISNNERPHKAKENQDHHREQLQRFVDRFRAQATKAAQAQPRSHCAEAIACAAHGFDEISCRPELAAYLDDMLVKSAA